MRCPRSSHAAAAATPSTYVVLGKRYYTAAATARASSSAASPPGTAASSMAARHRTVRSTTCTRMSAAHKKLPIPTYLEVTNLENGRRVIVRVNDRGPFHENRVIDLSYAAASRIGMLGKGTALVEIRAIDPSPATEGVADPGRLSRRPRRQTARACRRHATQGSFFRPAHSATATMPNACASACNRASRAGAGDPGSDGQRPGASGAGRTAGLGARSPTTSARRCTSSASANRWWSSNSLRQAGQSEHHPDQARHKR